LERDFTWCVAYRGHMIIPSAYSRSLSDLSRSTAKDFLNVVDVMIPSGAGELAQGQLPNGEDFLVTNPVSCFSHIRVGVNRGSGLVTMYPPLRTKAKKAVLETLKLFKIEDADVDVFIESDIPVGKGMASSTADIVGAIEATAKAFDLPITSEQVSDIAISIEPSDGLMYRGVVVYNHRSGHLLEELDHMLPMNQLIIDNCSDTIDTVAFNEIPKNYTQKEIEIQGQALELVREGMRTSNPAKIGRGATLSAQVNNRLLPKPHFSAIMAIANRVGAYGIVCAHSGTILSLLFSPENTRDFKKAHTVFKEKGFDVLSTHSVACW